MIQKEECHLKIGITAKFYKTIWHRKNTQGFLLLKQRIKGQTEVKR